MLASASIAVLKHGPHIAAWRCADWHSEGDRDCELFCFLPLVRMMLWWGSRDYRNRSGGTLVLGVSG